jgi:hypothetical protein
VLYTVPLGLEIAMKYFWSTGDRVGRPGAISGGLLFVVAKDDLTIDTSPLCYFRM